MKTIKYILPVLFIILSSTIFAQRVSLRFDAGYALTYVSGNNYNETQSPDYLFTYEKVKGGFGNGFSVNAGVGILFGNHFRTELNINYFRGFGWEYSIKYWDEFFGETMSHYSMNYNMLKIIPGFAYLPLDHGSVRPYGQVGVVIGVPMCQYDYNDRDDDNGDEILDTDEKTYKYTGGIPIGMSAAAGVEFMVGDNFAINLEINGTFISYQPQSRTATSWTRDGADYLGQANVYDKEMEFVEEYSRDYNNIDSSQPRKNTKITIPASNVEVRAGFKLYLGR